MSLENALSDLKSKEGTELHVSDWLTITQEMISAFADVTRDQQWIHVNPEMAKQYSPFGDTVAHGYFTLSLLSYLTGAVDPDAPRYPGVKLAVNYGLNRVRFPHPVVVGSRIRSRTTLGSAEEVKGNGIQIVNQVTVEIEGAAKPGCVAETVSRLYF